MTIVLTTPNIKHLIADHNVPYTTNTFEPWDGFIFKELHSTIFHQCLNKTEIDNDFFSDKRNAKWFLKLFAVIFLLNPNNQWQVNALHNLYTVPIHTTTIIFYCKIKHQIQILQNSHSKYFVIDCLIYLVLNFVWGL